MLSSLQFSSAVAVAPRPAPPLAAKSTTLIALDADDSAIVWKLFNRVLDPDPELIEQNAQAINQSPQSTLAMVTGRGILMSKELLKHLGNYGKKLMAWVGNNGQTIFYRPLGKPVKEWLSGLRPSDADKDWAAHVKEKTGWSHQRVTEIVRTSIEKQGFKKVNSVAFHKSYSPSCVLYAKEYAGNKVVLIEMVPDETAFTIQPNNFGDTVAMQKAFNDGVKISGAITKTMQAEGIRYDMMTKDYPHILMHYMYTPEGIQKGEALEWMLAKNERLKQVDKVIPIGDSDNDASMLVKDAFYLSAHDDNRVIPAFPILSGNVPKLFKRMVGVNKSAINTTRRGDLADAITTQLAQQPA